MLSIAFLHMWLLWGLALGSVPIIIHLFHRRKFRTVMWSAMTFLLSSSKLKARRLKILQLLLLLTRILIICLVVLALARPHLTGALFAGFLSGEKTASVILLDNSLSMGAKSGDTSFARAKKAIEEITFNFRRGDSLTLIAFSNAPNVIAQGVTDSETFMKIVENVAISDGSTNVQLGLARAIAMLQEDKRLKKEIYLITDSRRSGWKVDEVAEWERINRMVGKSKSPPKIHIVDVGTPEIANASLSNVSVEADGSSTAGKYQINVETRGYGSALIKAPVGKLFVDDMSKEDSRIIGSDYENGVSEGRQPFTLEEEGFHQMKVDLLEADALPNDNSRYYSIRHRRGLSVLCVEGARKGGLFKTSADLLRIALAPEKDMTGKIIIPADYTNIMIPELIPISSLYEKRLRDYGVVMLSSVASLSPRDYESLKYFVSRGGGLAIFMGDNIEAEKYNEYYDKDEKGLIPARIESQVGRASSKERKPDDPEFVLSEFDYMHPVMKNFKNAEDGDLTLFKFYAYYKVKADESDSDIKVLARFSSGDPFMIEKKVGRGKVILLTSDATLHWSNLGPRPAFLPLVHHLTRYLSGDASKRYNLIVGEPISYPLESSEKPVTIVNPVGTAFKVNAEMKGETEKKLPFVNFKETSIAGIYTLYPPDVAKKDGSESADEDEEQTEEKSRKVFFAVNPDPAESDLTPLDPKVMQSMLKNTKINYIDYDSDFEVKMKESRYGKEIWRYLLLGMLVFLTTESVLAYMIDRT